MRTHQDRLDACLRSESLSSTLPIQLLSSPPPAWLFGPHHSPQSKPVLDKAAVKRGKSRRVRSCGEAFFRRSKILNRSVYSIVIGWFTLSIQETNQRATGCSLSLRDGPWQKKTKKHSVGPLSASAHWENARYARLPIQPWFNCRWVTIQLYQVNNETSISARLDWWTGV